MTKLKGRLATQSNSSPRINLWILRQLRRKILIADSDQRLLDLTSMWLRENGYIINTLRTLEAAEKEAANRSHELVIIGDLGHNSQIFAQTIFLRGQQVLTMFSMGITLPHIPSIPRPRAPYALLRAVENLLKLD